MANRMTLIEKKEALQNALKSYKFPERYCIEIADKRIGQKFAISYKGQHGSLNVVTNFMTYDEFNAYLFGYIAGMERKFNPIIERQ